MQAEIDQPGVGGGDPARVRWCAGWVEGSQAVEVAEAGAIPGGQDDRIDPLALMLVPDDLIAVKAGEHRADVQQAVGQGLPEAHAVGDHAPVGDLAQPRGGQRVETGLAQPVVHVLAADPLRDEPQRMRVASVTSATGASSLAT